ncbi:MAG: SRPBCC domain-containing protein [Candidatus Moranbacteria bacterium]|nr:SRPBCC domain-containing protein [Candidatus Moranbacteria bacterium]
MREAKFITGEDGKTLIVKREFDAPLTKVWDAHTKSELLEQWWAPLPWKAVTKSFDFREGGHWLYYMLGPENERHWAWIGYRDIEPEKSFSGDDCFCDEDGNKNTDMPSMTWKTEFSQENSVTKLVSTVTFASAEDLEKLTAMGMKEGYTMGLNQLETLVTQ